GEETGLTSIDTALMDKKYKTVSKLLIETKEDAEASQNYDLEVTEEDVLETLSRLSGIPVAKLSHSDTKKYLNLEAELHKRVIGQEEALSAVSRAIRRT
ncbi:ATP-dependent Clp protease ATP-binding subunit, partial [Streptococcus suis]